MKRFIFGLLGFVVVWIVGLAPQFLAYAHISGIIIFALEGGLSMAGYLLYVRVVEKRHALELSRFRIALLPLGILIGLIWFGLLIAILYASGHYRINGLAFPNRLVSAVIFAIGTAIWEEVTFRGLLFRVTEQAWGTWVGVSVSAIAFGALHGLNPNASLIASIAIISESGILLAAAYFATRTLWLPIGLHFGWNFAEDFVFGVRISGHAARPAIVEGTLSGSSLWRVAPTDWNPRFGPSQWQRSCPRSSSRSPFADTKSCHSCLTESALIGAELNAVTRVYDVAK